MTCRSNTISIDESAILRIIISALQVIEPRLGIVVVASVADGVAVHDVGGVGGCGAVGAGDGNDIAPGIVAVVAHPMDGVFVGGAVLPGEEEALYIALGIGGIVVGCVAVATVGGIEQGIGHILCIVDEVHDHGAVSVGVALPYHSAVEGQVGMSHTVHYLLRTDALCIVVVGVGLVSGGEAYKLSAVLPDEIRVGLLPVGIADGVAACDCSGNGSAVVALTLVDNAGQGTVLCPAYFLHQI